MYTNNYDIEEYPYKGSFIRGGIIDEDTPLDEQEEQEIVVLTTPCDIAEVSHNQSSNFISASYSIFLPFMDKVEIKNGDIFRGSIYSMEISGKVIGIFPSEIGVKVYIKDLDS